MNSIYEINKGINKPIEFQGLKAQYIAYLAAGLVGLMLLFAILYIAGCSLMICLSSEDWALYYLALYIALATSTDNMGC